MKDKIVFWGSDENNQKILVTVRLRAEDKKVDIWTFPHEKLEEEFAEKMLGDWDEIDVDSFPDYATHIEREVTANDLLPENIKADRTDIVIRAEKEWFVKVLSLQLYSQLRSEVNALKEQVAELQEHDKSVWDTAKGYWNKVQQHIQARDLSRDQFSELRDGMNGIFNRLKELISLENSKYEDEAKSNFATVSDKINGLLKQAEETSNTQGIFNSLKNLQQEIKTIKLTRDGRRDIWKKIDVAFKSIKEKRATLFQNRNVRRAEGLRRAIEKMENSIQYDSDQLSFQEERMSKSGASQLEMQLREAKSQMVRSRITSKQDKLNDMYMTLKDLEKKVAQDEATLKAAAAAKAAKETVEEKAENIAEAAKETVSEKADDLVDTAKEEAQNVSQETESAVDIAKEKVSEAAESVVEAAKEKAAEAKESVENAIESAKETASNIAETVTGLFDTAKDKLVETKDEVTEKSSDLVDTAKEKVADTTETVSETASDIVESTEEKIEDVKDSIEDKIDDAKDAIDEATDNKA